jgi:peroxiredoxin Q/BCP
MLAVGDRAPEFSLADDRGVEVSLTAVLHTGSLLLYFYPADFTPGCTREACGIAEQFPTLREQRIRVLGVSPQLPDSHRRFRERYQLPFPLLCDPHKTVIRMYDVDGPLGIGVRRATYLIDPARVIRGAVLADFRIQRHMDFIRQARELLAPPGAGGTTWTTG